MIKMAKPKKTRRKCRLCSISGQYSELVEIYRDGKAIRVCKNCKGMIV